jgi:hypothetical protein
VVEPEFLYGRERVRLLKEFQTSVLTAIIVLVLVVIAIGGLIVLLSDPLVRGILALFALAGFLLLMKRASE